VLYAHDRHAVLLIFQAMDAAGKDSTIRAVFSGVNPAGCQVFAFKRPSEEELDHDFLWRSARRLPERGRFGIFNRSYYEEVLVVRVHPEILDSQKLPHRPPGKKIWRERFESIRDHEKHLARNGTVILKFWLNVSREEQRRRFLSRLDEPEKNWKFEPGDVRERGLWEAYQRAYEEALAATSRPWAPWYAVPADDKPFMRLTVARIVAESLETLGMRYPEVGAEERSKFDEMRRLLQDAPR
jgi:PPK2 family polyphosphate:nucleotide phosphotransferase